MKLIVKLGFNLSNLSDYLSCNHVIHNDPFTPVTPTICQDFFSETSFLLLGIFLTTRGKVPFLLFTVINTFLTEDGEKRNQNTDPDVNREN